MANRLAAARQCHSFVRSIILLSIFAWCHPRGVFCKDLAKTRSLFALLRLAA